MARWVVSPHLVVPDHPNARLLAQVWRALEAGEPVARFNTPDHRQVGFLPYVRGMPDAAPEERVAAFHRSFPNGVVRYQDMKVSETGRVMGVLTFEFGEGADVPPTVAMHPQIAYVVFEFRDDLVSGATFFNDLREAQRALDR